MNFDILKKDLKLQYMVKNKRVTKEIAESNINIFFDILGEHYTEKAILSFSFNTLYSMLLDFVSNARGIYRDRWFQALASQAPTNPFLLYYVNNKNESGDFIVISENENYPNSQVTSYDIGLVYVVTEGRNAWHSTWITKKEKMHFLASLDSAKDYCEKSRVQGSVFTIHEIPALAIRTQDDSYLFVELGESHPFSGKERMLGKLQICKQNGTVKALRTATLWEYAKRIEAHLKIHESGYNKKSKFVGLKAIADFGILDEDDDGLDIRHSYSNGGEYLLGWNEGLSAVCLDSLKKVVRNGYYEN